MKTEKAKLKGTPTGNVRVLITGTLHGEGTRGLSVGFTVYDITPTKLKEFFLEAINYRVKTLKEVKAKK